MKDIIIKNGVELKILDILPDYAISKCGVFYDTKKDRYISGFECGVPPYLSVNARRLDGKSKQFRLHRLVAFAWVHNDDLVRKTQVNHKDGNKFNNHADNLEWVTPAQNQRHAVSTGLKSRGENLYNSKVGDDVVHDICKLLMEGFRTKDVADKFNLPQSMVLKIRCGDIYFHVRQLYDIKLYKKDTLSEATVRWICENIAAGVSDIEIAKKSSNKKITDLLIKKIRHKIRYTSISSEYF